MLASHCIAYKVKWFTVRLQEVNWKQKGKLIQISWVPPVTRAALRAFASQMLFCPSPQPTAMELSHLWPVCDQMGGQSPAIPQVPGCHSGSAATGCRSSSWSAVPGQTWQKSWQQQPGAETLVNDKGCFALELLPGAASCRRSAPNFSRGRKQPALVLDISIKFTAPKKKATQESRCLGFCRRDIELVQWQNFRSHLW